MGPPRLPECKSLLKLIALIFLCISETKKSNLSVSQLDAIDTRSGFIWNWLPANNTAGGILVGVKDDMFDILSCDIHTYCISCLLKFKHNDTV